MKLRHVRFSLRTLVLLVLLLGALGSLWVLRAAWSVVWTTQAHKDLCFGLSFSPDKAMILSASYDGTVCLWEPGTGDKIRAIDTRPTGIMCAVFSPGGDRVLTCGRADGIVKLFDADSGEICWSIADVKSIYCAAFSCDGTLILLGQSMGTTDITCIDAEEGKPLFTLNGQGRIASLSVSPDGRTIASGAWDGSLMLWDLSQRRPIRTLVPPSRGAMIGVDFDGDGTRLVSGGHGGVMTVWRVSDGSPLISIDECDRLGEVHFSSDGERIFGNMANSLSVWDSRSGECLYQAASFPDYVYRTVPALDDKRVAVSWGQGYISLMEKKRPEEAWGVIYLPSFWLVIVLVGASLASVLADRRKIVAEERSSKQSVLA